MTLRVETKERAFAVDIDAVKSNAFRRISQDPKAMHAIEKRTDEKTFCGSVRVVRLLETRERGTAGKPFFILDKGLEAVAVALYGENGPAIFRRRLREEFVDQLFKQMVNGIDELSEAHDAGDRGKQTALIAKLKHLGRDIPTTY